MSKKPLAILAAAGALAIVPTATAAGGTPIGPGGCNMLAPLLTPDPVGLDPMMAGSGNGSGATNMLQTLALFSTQQFCGA